MGSAKVRRRQSGSSEKKLPSRGMLKKKAARNSIGKTRQKRGSAAKYMTRTKAVRALQLPLREFRRLCILKGIYPRDPPKKFKGSDKTYYYTKDVLYLQHEPLLAKFREMSALLKKVTRRAGRDEKADAVRLYDSRPVYRLDHLIRERYPTFPDALRDLDDALCLLHLFATLPASKRVAAERVDNCARLCREFQAYVSHAHCLQKVFISIKGIYYQAEVFGVRLLWLAPHARRQLLGPDVDERVLLTFLEFYEVLLQFVNFKLFSMARMAYPPRAAGAAGGGAVGAARDAAERAPSDAPLAQLLQPLDAAAAAAAAARRAGTVHSANLRRSHSPYERPGGEAMARLRKTLHGSQLRAAEAAEAAAGAQAMAEDAALDAAEHAAAGDAGDADGADGSPLLFDGLTFFLGRETPIGALEFVLRAFGARVSWDGLEGGVAQSSPEVTHEVIDRPRPAPPPPGSARALVQPQWVFDCANERLLLPAHAYAPGLKPPPHLSPFADGAEGYVPPERTAHPAFGPAAGPADGAVPARPASDDDDDDDDHDDDHDDDDDSGSEEEEEEEGEEEDEEDEEDGEEGDDVADAQRFARELEAERRGVPVKAVPRGAAAAAASAAAAARAAAPPDASEKKELAKMMLKKRDRRLYSQMQHGIGKRRDAADRLAAKRAQLSAAQERGKGGGKGAAKGSRSASARDEKPAAMPALAARPKKQRPADEAQQRHAGRAADAPKAAGLLKRKQKAISKSK